MQFKDATCKPSEIQQQIVGRIEAERKIVEGNRELIQTAPRDAKIKQVIPLQGRCEKVWEW